MTTPRSAASERPAHGDRGRARATPLIGFVHPAPPRSRGGNRLTVLRWANVVRRLGYRVFVAGEWTGRPCDVLVALHAERSHASIARFRRARPEAPLVVVATGTDLYRDEPPAEELGAVWRQASRIVVLQGLAAEALPAEVRGRVRVIHQAVCTEVRRSAPTAERFELALVAHLRAVKDPLRAAAAARLVPARSRLRVLHVGRALEPELGARAAREARENPRYVWLGEQPHAEALRLIARSRALVCTSRHEGGPNTISEALALGVPVLASRIPGHLGLLGADYAGTYAAGDAADLARLIQRAEEEPGFLGALEEACVARAWLVDPAQESAAWRELLAELLAGGAHA